jgi:hypothetical protein
MLSASEFLSTCNHLSDESFIAHPCTPPHPPLTADTIWML